MPPDVPTKAQTGEEPLVETPLKITVILLTQLGMLVKSIEVPLVEATAVPVSYTHLTLPTKRIV